MNFKDSHLFPACVNTSEEMLSIAFGIQRVRNRSSQDIVPVFPFTNQTAFWSSFCPQSVPYPFHLSFSLSLRLLDPSDTAKLSDTYALK